MEEKKEVKKNDESFLKRYDTIFAFLGIEVLALLMFGLGGATGSMIFSLIGALIGILTYPYVRNNFSNKQLKRALICLIPIGILAVLLAFSSFSISSYSNKFSGIIISFATFVGLLGAVLLGAGLKNIKTIKKDYVLLGIGGGLALLTLIILFISMIKYGPFYVYRFKGMVYYFDGVLFKIDDEFKILKGFSISEASLSYALFPAFLLSLFGVGMFYYHPKEKTKQFVVCGVFAFIGLLAMAVTPYLSGLIYTAVCYLIFGIFALADNRLQYSKQREKIAKIIYVVFTVLVVLVLAVFIFCSIQKNNPLINIRASLFGKDGKIGKISQQIFYTFYSEDSSAETRKLAFTQLLFGVKASNIQFTTQWSFEFNVLMENGLLAFALLIYFIVGLIRKGRNYFAYGEDSRSVRSIVLMLIVGIIIYQTFKCSELPLKHDNTYLSLIKSSWMYLLFFLYGFTYEKDGQQLFSLKSLFTRKEAK